MDEYTEAVALLDRPRPPRDYSLTGADSRRAVDLGLADATWYRPPIDPVRLQALTVRSNGRAARDVVIWLGLLAGTGILAWFALGSWWSIPAFAAYGALYGASSDARWHECGHGTAFRSRRANDVVYYLASFMLLREPTLWRWSHVRHHSDTIIVGRDPEVLFTRPFRGAPCSRTCSTSSTGRRWCGAWPATPADRSTTRPRTSCRRTSCATSCGRPGRSSPCWAGWSSGRSPPVPSCRCCSSACRRSTARGCCGSSPPRSTPGCARTSSTIASTAARST